ncbi:U3 small nucleolar ribonucleoprotein mpp10 [Verticillium dahliae VDG1]|nr:U3 small nucleolar ribonucleoprotein mpp10 [Verticillium dahliae VDG1]
MNPTQQKPRAAKRAIPCIGLFMTRRSKPTTPTITVTNDQEELVLSKTATRKPTSRLRCALARPFDAASVEAPDVPQPRDAQGSVRAPPGKYVLELDFSHIKEMETASWLRERRPETPVARKMGPAFGFRRPMTSRGARPMY